MSSWRRIGVAAVLAAAASTGLAAQNASGAYVPDWEWVPPNYGTIEPGTSYLDTQVDDARYEQINEAIATGQSNYRLVHRWKIANITGVTSGQLKVIASKLEAGGDTFTVKWATATGSGGSATCGTLQNFTTPCSISAVAPAETTCTTTINSPTDTICVNVGDSIQTGDTSQLNRIRVDYIGLESVDTVAPVAVTNLAVSAPTSTTAVLTFTAPGDDNTSGGPVSSYDLRYATTPITSANWASATPVSGEPTPGSPGATETISVSSGLTAGQTYYFALQSVDDNNNLSPLSNSPSITMPTATSGPNLVSFETTPPTLGSISTGHSYTRTQADDGTYEALNETQANASAPYRLDHTWKITGISLPSGQLKVNAQKIQSGGDAFNVTWATATGTGSSAVCGTYNAFSSPCAITAVSPAETTCTTAIIAPTNVLCIRVVDSTTTSDTVINSVRFDYIAFADVEITPPANVTDLAVSTPTSTTATLTFTAPGDDANVGTATSYDLRYSKSTITLANWSSATQATTEPNPSPAGTREKINVSSLTANTPYYFALRTIDDAGNQSGLSNVAAATTPPVTNTLNYTPAGTGSGTVSSVPAGIDSCSTSCSAQFAPGQAITLIANPTGGSYFSRWDSDIGTQCRGSYNPCQFSMSSSPGFPNAVTATFETGPISSISGRVTSTDGGGGIPGVLLSTSWGQSATTDSNGDYTITPLGLSATTRIDVSLTNHVFDGLYNGFVSAGATGVNFTTPTPLSNGVSVNSTVNSITPNSDVRHFSVIVPAGTSYLTINTSNASGDVDLQVKPHFRYYAGSPVCDEQQTSGNESCIIEPPFSYEYEVTVSGYSTGSQSFTITANWGTPPSVSVVSGVVTDNAGNAISGVTIDVKETTGPAGIVSSAVTDSLGGYSIAGLKKGVKYSIFPRVGTGSFHFYPVDRKIIWSGIGLTHQNFTGTPSVSLGNGVGFTGSVNDKEVKQFRVDIPPGMDYLTIESQSTGSPLNFFVNFGSPPLESATGVATVQCGTPPCSYSHPQPGTYYVSVSLFQFGTYPFTIIARWGTGSAGSNLISGTVTDETGVGLPGFPVVARRNTGLFNNFSEDGGTAITDSSGSYTLVGLPPSSDWFVGWSGSVPFARLATNNVGSTTQVDLIGRIGVPFPLQNGIPVDALLSLPQHSDSEFEQYTVTIPPGVSNLTVSMTGPSRAYLWGTDFNLYVRFGAEPDLASFDCRPYLVPSVPLAVESCSFTSPSPGTYYVKVFNHGPVSLSEYAPYQIKAVWSTALAKVSGRVTNTTSGNGMSGVTISAGGSNTATDAAGNYSLSLAPGTYMLTPSLSGYAFSPATHSVNVNSADITGKDFSGGPSKLLSLTMAGTGNAAVWSSPPRLNCATNCSVAFPTDSLVTLTAVSQANSTFAGWSGVPGCTGTAPCQVKMNQDTAIIATFDHASPPPQGVYFLNAVTGGPGGGTIIESATLAGSTQNGAPCGTNCVAYPSGTMVTLTANPSPGAVFVGWSGRGCVGTGSCTVTMFQDSTVTAIFDWAGATYGLTTTIAGTGLGTVHQSAAPVGTCGANCVTYAAGTLVTLTAYSDQGATFLGWSGTAGCTGTGACTITMNKDQSVTAEFVGGFVDPPIVSVPPLTLGSPPTGNGTTFNGETVLARSESVVITWQPNALPTPIRAAQRCRNLVMNCYEKNAGSIDSCMRSAPVCTTSTPWNESAACCDSACWPYYRASRLAGIEEVDALNDAVSGAPSCQSGVDAQMLDYVPIPRATRDSLLQRHNQLREQHCAAPLNWSTSLASAAQKWADQIVTDGCAVGIDPASGISTYSQNTILSTHNALTPEQLVDTWYSSITSYDFTTPESSPPLTQTFSTVVWKGVSEIGCGTSTCNGKDILVCNYSPTSNVIGQFAANVQAAPAPPASCPP